ncbi:MAG: hypothetical protein R6V56_06470 [Lentisphaeria bacterium]
MKSPDRRIIPPGTSPTPCEKVSRPCWERRWLFSGFSCCPAGQQDALQLENPRRVAAASTRRARASFGDMSTFRREPLAYG